MSSMPDYDATPKQKRYIAILCKSLGIRELVEEALMTKGGAGRIISNLQRIRRVIWKQK